MRRRCSWSYCPRLVEQGERYCPEHKHSHERERGAPSARGYGAAHRRERERWAQLMEQGARPICKRCGHVVLPTETWDLGHSDDRTAWTGPEHSACNRRAGQANSTRMRERWNQRQQQSTNDNGDEHDTSRTTPNNRSNE